jgi:hypothetical protein
VVWSVPPSVTLPWGEFCLNDFSSSAMSEDTVARLGAEPCSGFTYITVDAVGPLLAPAIEHAADARAHARGVVQHPAVRRVLT